MNRFQAEARNAISYKKNASETDKNNRRCGLSSFNRTNTGHGKNSAKHSKQPPCKETFSIEDYWLVKILFVTAQSLTLNDWKRQRSKTNFHVNERLHFLYGSECARGINHPTIGVVIILSLFVDVIILPLSCRPFLKK